MEYPFCNLTTVDFSICGFKMKRAEAKLLHLKLCVAKRFFFKASVSAQPCSALSIKPPKIEERIIERLHKTVPFFNDSLRLKTYLALISLKNSIHKCYCSQVVQVYLTLHKQQSLAQISLWL